MKVLAFGEVVWDVIEEEFHLGGAPINFAAHSIQCGNDSAIISALGFDELGDEALELIEKMGVDVSLIQKNNRQTGLVPVTLKNGQPIYEILNNVAFDFIGLKDIDLLKVQEYDVFYFGTLIQRNKQSRETLFQILDTFQFEDVFYDVNLRKDTFTIEAIRNSLLHCTILKVNDEELHWIGKKLFGEAQDFDSFCEKIVNQFPGIKTIIITVGEKGSFVYSENYLHKIPTKKEAVKDAVGAGDAYSAAFLSVYFKTGDVLQAASLGNQIAGYVATSSGAIPVYSNHIKNLMNKYM
ncbi:MAG: carbohydrate kinase [Cyclobacteriaceae bacterium]